MERSQIDEFRRKLAELAESPETSSPLKAYLKMSLRRDCVDVINELDVLARIANATEPERSGSLSSQSF